jgi:hypothetical protein
MGTCKCGAEWNSDGVCHTHNQGEKMIIGLAGTMGSGKDTAGNFLKEKGFETIAFADNLKQMAMEVFRLSERQCYDQELKMKPLLEPVKITMTHISRIMVYAEQKNGFSITKEEAMKLYALVDNGIELKTPREILQYLGTEILRDCINPNYHALVVKHAIDSRNLQKVAITDCRFPNERNFIKRWGGKNISN